MMSFSIYTLTRVENPAHHPREHHEEHGQQLQVATQDATSLNMRQTLGRQATLDNHLQKHNMPQFH